MDDPTFFILNKLLDIHGWKKWIAGREKKSFTYVKFKKFLRNMTTQSALFVLGKMENSRNLKCKTLFFLTKELVSTSSIVFLFPDGWNTNKQNIKSYTIQYLLIT